MGGRNGHMEVLVRGVDVRCGRLLVCHGKGAATTYLPGGHVDFLEGAREALVREIDEEMGRTVVVERFLGAVEHTFRQKGRRKCEVNLLFAMRVQGLRAGRPVTSREPWIEFLWVALDDLETVRLEPHPLVRLIRAGQDTGDAHLTAWWGSTYRMRALDRPAAPKG